MSLFYKGHVFDFARCSCCDKKQRLLDPTQTQSLRNKFKGTMRLRWQSLRTLVRSIIVDHDLLGLKGHGLMGAAQPAITGGGTKLQGFQRWFDMAMEQSVFGRDGSVMRPFLVQAYNQGAVMGQDKVNQNIMSSVAVHRIDTIFQLAVTELQGIIEAVSQQASRQVAYGLLHNSKPMEIMRAIFKVIDTVGINRTNSMIGLLVTKAHAGAVLDIYRAAGIMHVGLVAEGRGKKVTDIKPAKRKRIVDAMNKGAGSRTRNNPNGPSASTIGRIFAQQQKLQSALGNQVNVVTAGDDDVCPICQDIEGDNPYTLDEAQQLIPAHPDCRCTFEPADSADDDNESLFSDANMRRDPKRGRFVPHLRTHQGLESFIARQQKLVAAFGIVRRLPTVGGNERDIANPLPMVPDDMRAEIDKIHEGVHAWTAYARTDGKDEFVPLSSLVTMQGEVDRARVLKAMERDLASSPDDLLPTVIYYKGYSILWDGNHRAVAAYYRGDDTVRARSFKLDDWLALNSADPSDPDPRLTAQGV